MEKVEVAIVGAGAAGLAAAHALAAHGVAATVLEARRRAGGRIFTRRVAGLPAAIELGAEFVHGDAPLTRRLLDAAGDAVLEIGGEHLRWVRGAHGIRSGEPRREDFWRAVNRGLRGAAAVRRDVSVAEFLARHAAPPGAIAAARAFVEGFHAAPTEAIGVRGIAPDDGEPPSGEAARIGRPRGGYGGLVRHLARPLRDLRLATPVQAVDWDARGATLTLGGGRALRARAVLLTVPPALLGDGLRLDPMPPAVERARAGIAMGHVARVELWFDALPWSRHAAADRLRSLAFLHLPGPRFPVWWSGYPLDVPRLVAWCGGPAAESFLGVPRPAVVRAALDELAGGLGVARRALERALRGAFTHDWSGDRRSRGAYSYARVGAAGAGAELARAGGRTLFFAGEATAAAGATGTVEGALGSGYRAARAVVRALRS